MKPKMSVWDHRSKDLQKQPVKVLQRICCHGSLPAAPFYWQGLFCLLKEKRNNMKKIMMILFLLVSSMSFGQGNLFVTLAEGEAEDRERNDQESEDNQGSADAALDGLNDFFNIMNS